MLKICEFDKQLIMKSFQTSWFDINRKLGYVNAKRAAIIFPFIGQYILLADKWAWDKVGTTSVIYSDVISFVLIYQSYIGYFSALSLSIGYYLFIFFLPKFFIDFTKKEDFINMEKNNELENKIKELLPKSIKGKLDSRYILESACIHFEKTLIVGILIRSLILISGILGIIYILTGIIRVVLTIF